MMNTCRRTRTLLTLVAASMTGFACTYQTATIDPVIAELDPGLNPQINLAVGVLESFSDDDLLSTPERLGHSCAIHKFPVAAAPALRESLQQVISSSFATSTRLENDAVSGIDHYDLLVNVAAENFETQLGYSPGIWTGFAHAEANLTISATISRHDGSNVFVTTISGDGSNTDRGGCAAGATALAAATSVAIEEVVTKLALELRASDQIKAYGEVPAEETVARDTSASTN